MLPKAFQGGFKRRQQSFGLSGRMTIPAQFVNDQPLARNDGFGLPNVPHCHFQFFGVVHWREDYARNP